MKIAEKQFGPNTVVQVLEQRLGADKAVAFKDAVGRVLNNGNPQLYLDLSQVEFIDSSGLGAILSLLKRMEKGRELIICGLTEPVASMFKLTRMDRVFTIYKNVEQAVSARTH
ncbi:MAG TPA: STAS domain-containing protein [Candidatus Angelobacter sp.]|nr:STAS domain-containing protein [Candidatus Angelobacter sp.]